MFLETFEHYKKNCGNYNNVFVDIKKLYFLFSSLPFIFILIPILVGIIFKRCNYVILSIIIIFFTGALIFYLLNHKAKELVKNKFGIKVEQKLWNTSEVNRCLFNKDKKKLIRYFLNTSTSNDELKEILNELEEQLPSYKPSFPVLPSIFGALFISLWNNFFSWMFKHESVVELQDAFIIVLIGLIFMVFFGILIFAYKSIMEVFFDVFQGQEYSRMKRFHRIMKTIVKDGIKIEI